jgi:hypothetical protein
VTGGRVVSSISVSLPRCADVCEMNRLEEREGYRVIQTNIPETDPLRLAIQQCQNPAESSPRPKQARAKFLMKLAAKRATMNAGMRCDLACHRSAFGPVSSQPSVSSSEVVGWSLSVPTPSCDGGDGNVVQSHPLLSAQYNYSLAVHSNGCVWGGTWVHCSFVHPNLPRETGRP